jgi:hypothetical protein
MDAPVDVSAVTERPSWDDVEVKTASQPAMSPESEIFSDTLLDLDEFDNAAGRAIDEDVVLDLDFEAPLPVTETWPESVVGNLSSPVVANGSPNTVLTSGVGLAEALPETEYVAEVEVQVERQAEVPQSEVAPPTADVPPIGFSEVEAAAPMAATSELSQETIDAIARRVVEQMTERVVREIAWEVVPDLAELLIKERLDKQK